MNHFAAAANSVIRFMQCCLHHQLRLRRERLGKNYSVGEQTYTIFRETVRLEPSGDPYILVIGFRLKLIRSSRVFHWLFQRLCIATTPFWSGMPGFHIKLWMVDQTTNEYAGIYEWRGQQAAEQYLDFLLPILRFFSVRKSVWHDQPIPGFLEYYLQKHKTE